MGILINVTLFLLIKSMNKQLKYSNTMLITEIFILITLFATFVSSELFIKK